MFLHRTLTPTDRPLCPRYTHGFKSGQGVEFCPAAHAERNALINAARHGIRTAGATMYMSCPVPCKDCATEIINAGVVEVVCTSLDYYDEVSRMLFMLASQTLLLRTYEV